MDKPENHLPPTFLVGCSSMEKEWKELMGMTNILCGKVFEFCRQNVSAERKNTASEVTARLKAIVDLMENVKQK